MRVTHWGLRSRHGLPVSNSAFLSGAVSFMSSTLVIREAWVVRIDGPSVLVELIDAEGCCGCNARSSCGIGLLGRVFRRSPSRFTLRMSEPLSEGDRVSVGLHPSALMVAAVLGFGLPLSGLLLGSAGTVWLTPGNSDALALLGGLGGLLIGLALVRWRFRRAQTDARFQPVLLGKR